MKKRMLSLVLAFALLCIFAVPAQAADGAGTAAQLEKTTGYLISYVEDAGGPTYLNDTTTLFIVRSGVQNEQVTAYTDAFLQNVQQTLSKTGGKLYAYNSATHLYDIESPVYYANVSAALAGLGYDPTDFAGYDLIESIRSCDRSAMLSLDCISLSYILTTFSQFADASDEALLNELIDAILSSYRETEEAVGFDYWGIGPDNNQRCVTALLPFTGTRADVKEAVEKTIAWTVGAIDESGFLHDSYADQANADSTGRGLSLFSAAGEMEAADTVYRALMTLALENGGFAYQPGQQYDNAYATGDAYEGLIHYARVNAGETALYDLSDTAYFRAEEVKAQIAAIPDTVTLDDQDGIAAIRAAYDALSPHFKAKIGDISRLTDAEAAIEKLAAAQLPTVPEGPSGTESPDTGDSNTAVFAAAACIISALAAFALRRKLLAGHIR